MKILILRLLEQINACDIIDLICNNIDDFFYLQDDERFYIVCAMALESILD